MDVLDGIKELAKEVISESANGVFGIPLSDNAKIVVKTEDFNNGPDTDGMNRPVKSIVAGLNISF